MAVNDEVQQGALEKRFLLMAFRGPAIDVKAQEGLLDEILCVFVLLATTVEELL
jgi:hypothetical protein